MNITLDQIATQRARLREEIMERECLLAALDIIEKYTARGHAPHTMELGSLVAALLPSRSNIEIKELPSSPPSPAPAALPPTPAAQRYVHPELRAMPHNSSYTKYVRWAIGRLEHDYTSRDIATLLANEGHLMTSAEISVVLTRLKRRGEIDEIRPGTGRTPAVFRKNADDTDAEEVLSDAALASPA